MMATALLESQNVLKDIDEWQEMKKEVQDSSRTSPTTPDYEAFADDAFNPVNKDKKKEEFRNYENSARQERVAKFYKIQHELQSYEFVEKMHQKYLPRLYAQDKSKGLWMSVWEALEYLNQIVDDSDPDTNLPQIQHALQTAEAIREKWPEEEFDWFPLVGLIHDLGKIIAVTDKKLGLEGEPQWATVGDTFPVGAPFSEKNVFYETFKANPDFKNPKYNTGTGIYEKECGLFNVRMSWGHDEYLWQVCNANGCKLPLAAQYMIRYHSFYPWHKEGAYDNLCNSQDRFYLGLVKEFNQFDLYSKSSEPLDVEKLKPYYQKLIAKYFPEKLLW